MEKSSNVEEYFPLEFTNITLIDSPILKDYYWQWFNLTELNQHLLTAKDGLYTIFNVKVPPMPVNSMPVKIVLHMYNESYAAINWKFKRIKLCNCTIQSVPVGINSFKKKFMCPHRELLHISPTEGTVEGQESTSAVLYISYRLYGQTTIAYEMIVDDRFKLRMNFEFNIHEFDPVSCVITREIFPVYIGTVSHIVQPIWIFNHYNQDMTFEFSSNEAGLRIVTKTLFVKRYSLTPLLIKYRPTRVGTVALKFIMTFADVRNEFSIKATGALFTIAIPAQLCPRNDIPTIDAPYTLYENYIGIKLETTENSATMVAVHNFSDKSVQFKWLNYRIEQYFSIEVIPDVFCCKPNHTALCLINLKAEDNPCIFFRVPIGCEVYEYNKTMPGDNGEDGDDENISESSLDQHGPVLITRLWLNMNFRIEGPPNIQIPTGNHGSEIMNKCLYPIPANFDRNVLEKIFWNHIFGSKFLHKAMNRKMDEYCYNDLLDNENYTEPYISRRLTMGVMRLLLSEAVTEISKRWRFIPLEMAF